MRRAMGFIVFAALLGGAVWVGVASEPRQRRPLEEAGLAGDIPIPWDRFHDIAGARASTFFFRPLASDLSREGRELLDYFRDAMASQGWTLVDEEIAGDGAWTAGWSKEQREVRLTFSAELRGDEVTLIVEQCPPARLGTCNPSTLYPLEESLDRK